MERRKKKHDKAVEKKLKKIFLKKIILYRMWW